MNTATRLTLAAAALLLIGVVGFVLTEWGGDDLAPSGAGVTPGAAGDGVGDRSGAPRAAQSALDGSQPPGPIRVEVGEPSGGSRGPSVRVRARAAETGAPLPVIALTIEPDDGRHPALHARHLITDAHGEAELADLAAGSYRVVADRPRPGHEDATRRSLSAYLFGKGGTIQLQLGEGSRLQLVGGGDSGGLVAGGIMLGISEGKVEFQPAGAESEPEPQRELVRPRQTFELDERLPVRGDELIAARFTLAAADVTVDVALTPGILARGEVRDADGEVVAGAAVLRRTPHDRQVRPVAVSDESGRFQILDLPPGAELLARAPGHAQGQPVEACESEPVVLALGRRVGQITGVVHATDDRPLSGVRIRIGEPDGNLPPLRVRTDDAGRFGPVDVAEFEVPVLALAPGFEPWAATVRTTPEQPTQVDIVLGPGWIIEGRLSHADGSDAGGVRVAARAEDRATTDVRTGPGGVFRLECLPPGPVTLHVDGDADWLPLEVQAQGFAGQIQRQELTRMPMGLAVLHVVDDRGEPLRDWVVRATPIDAEAPTLVTEVDAGGECELRMQPGLTYRLDLQARDVDHGVPEPSAPGVIVFRQVQPPRIRGGRRVISGDQLGWPSISGSAGRIELMVPARFLPTARLRGRLVDATGNPRAGRLTIAIGDGERAVRIGEDGRLDSGDLVPGSFTFRIAPDGSDPFSLDVTELGARQQLDLGDVLVR